jgi:DNA-binding SARP family transcriptional activator
MDTPTTAHDTSGLSLHFLGELAVCRHGQALTLPPSKKTRALLAYLALNPRPFRREHLCELLWEIPDDPRGSLRWSLSKLRRLVDDNERPRIIADRSQVTLDCDGISVDVAQLTTLSKQGLDAASTDQLATAAEQFCAPFLDGLELANFHDFYSWRIAVSEEIKQAQAKLLSALISRLPVAQAVPYNQQLCALIPYDITARASLIRHLTTLGRTAEAEHQHRQGATLLKTAGIDDRGRLYQALHSAPAANTATIIPSTPSSTDRATDLLTPHCAPMPISPTPTSSPAAPRLPTQFAQLLVGRDQEIQTIGSALQGCCEHHTAAVVLLRGEPGIGKSHLLNSAAAMAREVGATVLKAAAFESERVRPFGVWNDALRRLLPANATSELLESNERISRNQVFDSLSTLLQQQTSQHPVLLLLDDLQWCDESSASALHYVLRINRSQPILVVAAARESELRDNNVLQQALRGLRRDQLLRECKLEPLDGEQLIELINQHAPDVDAAKLSRECNGNPLLALELARAEQQGGRASSLNELVEERLSRLEHDAVEVLSWAAILAPRINLQALEQVSNLHRDIIDRSLEQAEYQGILHPAERGFRFSHDLIARCVYDNLSPSRRQSMHCRIAERLEVDSAKDLQLAADLAHHAARSGEPKLATSAMITAARLCLRFYANEDALKLYQQGLQFSEQLSELERICSKLELAEIRVSAAPLADWQVAADDLIELAESALDHGALRYARQGYQLASYLRWVHGHCGEALSDSLQGERVTRGGTDKEQVVGMAEAAKCLALLERDLSQADAMIMEARALATRQAFNCVAIPTCLGILRYYEGQWEQAIEHLEDARTLCKSQGDHISEFMANEYLANIEVERGNFRRVAKHGKAMLAISSRLREGSEAPLAEAMTGLCRYALDGDDHGLEEACQDLRLVDAKQRLAYMLNRIAQQDIAKARWDSAQQRSTEALALAQTMERPTEILLAYLNLATIYEQQPRYPQQPRLPHPQQQLQTADQPEPDLAEDSILEHIRSLSKATVGAWARQRAQHLLNSKTEGLDP